MSTSVDIETLKNILRESCFGATSATQQASMEQLEAIKGQDGVVPLLFRIVDVNDAGATVPTEVRQLASLAAKCAIQRHWTEKTNDRQLSEEDKNTVKSFLLSYRSEPECHIANQLSATIAKIMRSDWPASWGNIIATLIRGVDEENIVVNIRSMVTLDEILTELQSKAVQCPDFKKTYDNLCVQLYPSISKAWALTFKGLQAHLASMNVNAAEYVVGAPSPYGVEDRNQSVKVYYLTRICNVIRMIIENSYVSITALPTFKTFWKTYVGALQMISGFLRKARPLANVLLQQAVINGSAVARRGPGINTKWDESSDDTCDYYIPAHLFNEHNSGLFSYLNMLLKLNKSLACTPVHLQRMYSMEVVPYLEQLLAFFYNHLAVEYDLASSSSSAGAAAAKKGPQLLPLCYLTTTAIYFLHNVLSCSAYDSVNVHKQKKRQAAADDEDGQMEEVEMVADVANAHEIRSRFFSSDKVRSLVQMMLHFTLRYKNEDFREWGECSESFYLCQVCPSEKCTMRSASECLYSSLLEFDPSTVSQVIFSYLNDKERQMNLTSLPDTAVQRCGFHPGCEVTMVPPDEILLYEAVYLCASFSVSQFSAQGDCTLWLRGVCGPVFGTTAKFFLDQENPRPTTAGARLLLSRLPVLLSAYADHFITPCVYCICDLDLSMINASVFDEMIKLSAVTSLAQTIQSFGFSTDSELTKFQRENVEAARGAVVPPPDTKNFAANAPFAHRMINVLVLTVQSCCKLISELEECESKLIVLSLVKECIQVLSTVHNEMKFEVMFPIADYLSKLWAMTSDRDPTRSTLLEVFHDLIKSANSHSVAFHGLALPLISYSCTTVSRCCHGSLLRDGVALWLAVMRNTVVYSEQLDELFFNVMSSLFNNGNTPERSVPTAMNVEASAFDADLIKDLMLVVESYVLLGKSEFIGRSRNQHVLFAIFSAFVGKVNANLVQYITRPLELLLVVNSEKTAEGVVKSDVASSFLLGSGMLAHLCRIVLASCQCQIITGVFQPFVSSDVANLHYITVVMRVLLTNPSAVLAALSSVKQEIFSYLCRLHNLSTAECNLTESVLLNQVVLCALSKKDGLEYVSGSLLKQKVWCLAMASLYPSQVTKTHYTLESVEAAAASSQHNGCIFEAIKNYLSPPPPLAAAPVPVVKAVTTTEEDASYAWKEVVTTEHQVRWINGLVKLAEVIVNKVGVKDTAVVTPRISTTSTASVSSSSDASAAVDPVRKDSLYSSALRELIATSGEDVMTAEDLEVAGLDEEPVVNLFLQTMYEKDVVLNGNVAEIVMAKLNYLRLTIGEEQYRQLNISC